MKLGKTEYFWALLSCIFSHFITVDLSGTHNSLSRKFQALRLIEAVKTALLLVS